MPMDMRGLEPAILRGHEDMACGAGSPFPRANKDGLTSSKQKNSSG